MALACFAPQPHCGSVNGGLRHFLYCAVTRSLVTVVHAGGAMYIGFTGMQASADFQACELSSILRGPHGGLMRNSAWLLKWNAPHSKAECIFAEREEPGA